MENLTVIKTIAMESRGESLLGQIAVASVIRNRAKERCLSFETVCLQPFQFSCWNKGAPVQYLTVKDFEMAQKAWELSEDVRLDANLYYNAKLCSPAWAKSDKVKLVAIIGNHTFMKE